MPTRQSTSEARLSRRLLLTSFGTGALATVNVAPDRASAQAKVSKQVVAYQDHPDGSKRCDRCTQFQPPSGCKVVQGSISPEGSCRLFVLKGQQARASIGYVG